MKLIKTIFIAGASFLWMASANADILFENPFPTSAQGGWCSPCDPTTPDYRVYDEFSLATDAMLTTVEFAIHDISSPFPSNNIDITIFTDNTFATPVFSAVYDNTQYSRATPFGDSFPFITVDLPDVALAAGSYFISFFGVGGTAFGMPYSESYVDGSGVQIDLASGAVLNSDFDIAFRISGDAAVPVPGVLALLGLGFIGLVATRRKFV